MGTADAIFQNINQIHDINPNQVCVFGGDHIYKMDVSQMLDYHKAKGADLTISAIPVPVEEASEFGVMEINENWELIGFEEKPANPKTIPGNPNLSLVSMGNYIFDKEILVNSLYEDAKKETPRFCTFGRAGAAPFRTEPPQMRARACSPGASPTRSSDIPIGFVSGLEISRTGTYNAIAIITRTGISMN